jgi:hypothetical protein
MWQDTLVDREGDRDDRDSRENLAVEALQVGKYKYPYVRKALYEKQKYQGLTSVLPLRAGELNVRLVPEVRELLLVIVSGALADREAKKKLVSSEGKFFNEVLGKRTSNTEVATFAIEVCDEGASNGKNFIG